MPSNQRISFLLHVFGAIFCISDASATYSDCPPGANVNNPCYPPHTKPETPTAPHGASVLGPSEAIYDWQRDHCSDGVEPWQWDVPDGPPRMWRRVSGEVSPIISLYLDEC